ncbi:MAG TPA: ABC transporter permease [Acidimicrobiales bacterium]|nr:ABC transporter permease [Acidimicrobiales bacterium]
MWRLLKGALAHRRRLLHTTMAVALAVSLVSGTFALTDTIDAAFEKAAAPSPGEVDIVVRSTTEFTVLATTVPEREPVPESLLATVRSIPGVRAAWGSVWGFAELVDDQGRAIGASGLPTVGTGWTPDATITAGQPPARPDEVAIDARTAARYGLELGDRVKVLFQDAVQEFRINGLRAAANLVSSTLATFDLETAKRLLGRAEGFDTLSVQAEPGVGREELRARLGAALPDAYEAVTNDQAARQANESWTEALGFLTTALWVFAAIALLVSAFIIFNTFSIIVAQRHRELAVLRALGASRGQLTASILVEAAAVGAGASVAGVLLGLGAARALLALLGAGPLDVPAASVVFRPRTAVAGLASGVLVTAAAALVPARRATTSSPVGARDVLLDGAGRPSRRLLAGGGTALVGLVALWAGVSGGAGRPLALVGTGSVAILAGLAVLAPMFARPAARALGAPLGRLLGEPALLGRENAMRNPRRTAATAAALMIGIGLIGLVAILGASMKASAKGAVAESLKADLVVTAEGGAGQGRGVPPVVASRLGELPEVQVVSQIRGGQWGLYGRAQTLVALDPATLADVYRLDEAALEATRRLDERGVLVRDTVAARHGWRIGDEVPMTFARTGTRAFRLRDTFSAPTVRSDFVISLQAFEANFAQQLDLEVDVLLAPGTAPAAGRAAIERALGGLPRVSVMDRSQVFAAQAKQVDSILVPVTALLSLSVAIALLGIANTLSLSIHERTRELGLLRAIGMARRQLRSMIRSEAMIVACLGAALGVGVAVFFGWALVAAMHDLGVTRRVFPIGQLLALLGAATLAGLVAGILPARRAAKLAVLDAVAGE